MRLLEKINSLNRRLYPVGIDMDGDRLRLLQLSGDSRDNGLRLVGLGSEARPVDVEYGSGQWQRWAIETIKNLIAGDGFAGKEVVGSLPANEVFVSTVKVSDNVETSLEEAVFSKIGAKLGYGFEEAMIRCVRCDEDNVVVMALERKRIDSYLAIYEEAHLRLKSICVWPMALIEAYKNFFGRRKSDIDSIVMLVDIGAEFTKVVICKHGELLFGRLIPIGACNLGSGADDVSLGGLTHEVMVARRDFGRMYKNAQIERLIFFSGRAVSRESYMAIARQLEMPAQIGDCFGAVEVADSDAGMLDRSIEDIESGVVRVEDFGWATAFGLSLSGHGEDKKWLI
ncbi:pilus assembly protein PilM [Planctomycetota bacterium]